MMGKRTGFPARSSDLINLFASEAYVPEIHLIIQFENHVDGQRLKQAIRLLLDAEPVLGCQLVEGWRKAYWKRLSGDVLDNADLLEVISASGAEQENASQTFFGAFIDGTAGPQIKGLLLSSEKNDRLLLKINHATCDAGGFKEVLYRLGSIYNQLGLDATFQPAVRSGSRSLNQVYQRFSLVEKIGILKRGWVEMFRASTPLRSQQYLSTEDKSAPLLFKFKHFSSQQTERLMTFTRLHRCTLNDLVVTAVVRAMASQANWNGDKKKAMRINGTVDLRRYLARPEADALCMLSGVYSVILKAIADNSLEHTLSQVKAQIDEHKSNYLGLGIMLALYLMLWPYPYFLKKVVMKKQWRKNLATDKVPPAMTNLGRIDQQRVDFGAAPINSIVMAAPACCPPWFCCGLSGYAGTLTLSAGVYPSAVPAEQMDAFFALVDEELADVERPHPENRD